MTSTVHTLARYQAVLVSGGDLGSPGEVLLEDLVRFLTAGLQAPVSPAGGGTENAHRAGLARPEWRFMRDQARARDSLAATGLRLNGSGGQPSTSMKAVVISFDHAG